MFVGKPPGNHDRILDFSRAVTGNLYYVPTADFLDDPPGPGSAPIPEETYAVGSPPKDGSLGIGSLRQGPDRPSPT
jgi:putative iron-dependent peroxidase